MPTRISQYEKIADLGVEKVTAIVEVAFRDLGELPYGQKRMTEREEVDAYNALRSAPGGLYNYAEGIRQELERRLSGIDEDERLAEGVGSDDVRHTAYLLSFKYAERMKRLADKYDIPLVGLEPPPPPPVEETLEVGVEAWPDLMTSGTELLMSSTVEEELPPMMAGIPENPLPPTLPPPPTLQPEPSIL